MFDCYIRAVTENGRLIFPEDFCFEHKPGEDTNDKKSLAEIQQQLGPYLYSGNYYNNWEMINDFHFGGYAKFTDELISFINSFKKRHGVGLDPIYTGKMMFAIFDLAAKGYFKPDTTIVALHTGGLQGIRGFNERFGELIA